MKIKLSEQDECKNTCGWGRVNTSTEQLLNQAEKTLAKTTYGKLKDMIGVSRDKYTIAAVEECGTAGLCKMENLIVQDCAKLSSGTLAALTGIKKYDTLDIIQNSLVLFTKTQPDLFTSWQDAWKNFWVSEKEDN